MVNWKRSVYFSEFLYGDMKSLAFKGHRSLLKYFVVTCATQVAVCLAFVLLAWVIPPLEILLVAVSAFYAPTILLLTAIGNFSGERALTLPLLLGIALGILLYSFIGAIVLTRVRRERG